MKLKLLILMLFLGASEFITFIHMLDEITDSYLFYINNVYDKERLIARLYSDFL
jgi:hypothetical protein